MSRTRASHLALAAVAGGLLVVAAAGGPGDAAGQESGFGCMVMGEPCDPLATPDAAAPAPDPAVDMGHAKHTFEMVCDGCHALDLVDGYDKSREGWWTSIQHMVEYGMDASEAEQAEVLDYLDARRAS